MALELLENGSDSRPERASLKEPQFRPTGKAASTERRGPVLVGGTGFHLTDTSYVWTI